MSPLTKKARRRLLRTRQTLVFGALLAAVALVGAAALAVSLGRMASPLAPESFATPTSQATSFGAVPCPTSAQAVYPATERVRVRVLNGSPTNGAARAMAAELSNRGFQILPVDNAPVRVSGTALIMTGQKGVDQAYTLLLHAPDGAIMALDQRKDNSVDYIVGSDLQNLKPADSIRPGTSWITPLPDCVDAKDALAALPTDTSETASPDVSQSSDGSTTPPETTPSDDAAAPGDATDPQE